MNPKKHIIENWRQFMTEERKMIGGKEVAQYHVNLVDFDREITREIAQTLAGKLDAQLGEEIGRGSMGIVYEIRTQEGEGRDMILKITQFPHEKTGYTLARWKKRQLAHQKPELASILPDVGKIVDTIYDFEGNKGPYDSKGYLAGLSMIVYGIPVEKLEPLPPRLKEQLFGHGGGFQSKEAEKEWLRTLADPQVLIPVLRANYGDEMLKASDPGRNYTHFADNIQSGKKFEKEVLDLDPPVTFEDYLIRWVSQIKQLALDYSAKDLGKYGAALLQSQNDRLTKRLEDHIKVPQYPPEALKYFGIEGAHPSGEGEGPVDQFFNKLVALGPEGIKFWDTHRENVMMRPSTNEIVVSDVGLFKKGSKTRREGIERLPQVIGAKSKHKTIYKEDNSMFESEEKSAAAIDLLLRMVEKLESIDKSIDFLAAVMSGADPLEIELGQKAMGRLSTPRDIRKRREVTQSADITEILTINGKLLKSFVKEEIKNILKESKNEVK